MMLPSQPQALPCFLRCSKIARPRGLGGLNPVNKMPNFFLAIGMGKGLNRVNAVGKRSGKRELYRWIRLSCAKTFEDL